ncbi:MAG: insulinase family protein [Bryobacteraceae bacterium]|nr:insulinase family protein [Solibacteraceae bacterium]MCO5353594.1 insulinase family protein [Bryobacteraceae bacterium]
MPPHILESTHAYRRFLSLILCFALLAFPVLGQSTLPPGVSKHASVEGITEYRLANGLRVLLFPDPTKSTVTVNITYMVGSRHEGYGETGMAHLLEHLMFMGSKNHPDIKKELSDHGARPNGTTSFDRTNYFETFQATDENLNWALSMEADRMVNSFIAKKDLDTEMTVVRNEYESGENSPTGVLQKRVLSAMFDWHNYGNVPIGARSDIERVPIERLQAFYRRYYQPDNALLVVAGKIDEPKTLALVHKYFAGIPKPAEKAPATYTVEPVQDGERSVVLRRRGETQALMAGYKVPAGAHAEFPAVMVATRILGDVPSGRLHKALVETKKATSAAMFAYQLREPGMAFLFADLRKEQSLDDVRQTAFKVIDDVKTSKFTQEEVDRIKQQFERNFEQTINNSERVALNLSEWQAMGDWRLFFLSRDRMRKVTPADVQAAAEKYFIESNRTVGVFIPDDNPVRAEVPEMPDVDAMVKDYKGEAAISQGESFDPSTGNIDRRTIKADLANGLKLAFINKKTRGEQVTATLTLRFGSEAALRGLDTPGSLAGQMLMRGTKNRTRQQIQDEISKMKASVQVSGGTSSARATVTTTKENLRQALDLVAEVLKEPSFPADEFEQLRQQALANLERTRVEPTGIAVREMQRHLAPYPKGDIRYVNTFEEDIEEIKNAKLEDVKKFHADFYGVAEGELAIVGDFEPEAVQQQIATLFNNWKSPKPYARIERPFKPVAAAAKTFNTPEKANALWLGAIPLQIKDTDPDYPALLLGNYILGQQPLNSRLFARIRNKEGLSYGVGSMFQASALDDSGMFLAQAICSPDKAPQVEASFKDELTKIINDGYSAEEVEAAKKAWLQSRSMGRSNDAQLAGRLATGRYLDRPMAWDQAIEDKVAALTPQQIQAAMKKHLDLGKMSFFRGGDFEAKNVKF